MTTIDEVMRLDREVHLKLGQEKRIELLRAHCGKAHPHPRRVPEENRAAYVAACRAALGEPQHDTKIPKSFAEIAPKAWAKFNSAGRNKRA